MSGIKFERIGNLFMCCYNVQMQYKALVVDFDRTLITSKYAFPSKHVKESLQKAQREKNIHISIATARPFNKIEKIVTDLNLSGYSIVSGGAQLVNVKTGEYYYEYPLEKQRTQEICREIQKIDQSITLWVQDSGTDIMFTEAYMPVKPFIIVASGLPNSLAVKIRKQLSAHPGVFCTRVPSFEPGLVDVNIAHWKATKQNGIETLAKLYGISKKEIVGVGDGYNDYPLLQASGVKVAMGNAVDQIKEIADFIAPSVDDDGLVSVVNKYFT